jgi:acetyl esterase/lipase
VVIHGGSWRSGDRTQLPALNRYLTARGYATAAIAYLKRHAAGLGIDPDRLVLLGRSAGAQLAVVAAYTADDPAIRGAVAYYGPFDLEWGWQQKCKVLDSRTVLRDFLGGDPTEVPETYRAASALHLVTPTSPPVLLLQGAADTMVSPLHSYHLIERLKAAGSPYYMLLVPQATHASDINFSGPFGQMTTYAVERFLRVCFQKEFPIATEK